MSSANDGLGVNVEGLRERLPQQAEAPIKAENTQAASDAVKALNEKEAGEQKDEKDKKTFGRTPDGTGAYKTDTLPRWIERLDDSNARGSIYTVTSKAGNACKPSSFLVQSHYPSSSPKLTLLMP
jgi:hypothetical protein